MNRHEYSALLDDLDMTLEQQVVYMVFRRYMDYATGVTGLKRVVDYNEIIQTLGWKPRAGSRSKARCYSRDQVRRIIQKLVDAGLLVRLHDSGLRERMVFRLPLAVTGLVRSDEERDQSATKGKPQRNLGLAGVSDVVSATKEKGEERDISLNLYSLSTPNSEKLKKFPMHSDWRVDDDDRLQRALLTRGFDVSYLQDVEKGMILDEFVTYWMDRPDQVNSQAVWEFKFYDSVEFAMRRRA